VLQSTVIARINTTYTLTQVSDKAYMVSGEGVMVEDKSLPMVNTINATTFTGISGKINSDYAFDKHTGWVLNSTTNETISGTSNVKSETGTTSYLIEISIKITVLP
jgi:hypothetical protein